MRGHQRTGPYDRGSALDDLPASIRQRLGDPDVQMETQAVEPSTSSSSTAAVSAPPAVVQQPAAAPVLPPTQQQRLWCPVQGCPASAGGRHAGWLSFGSVKAHVDMHLLEAYPGRPSEEWMAAGQWTTCQYCGKLASRAHGNGIHKRCLAEQIAARPSQGHLGSHSPASSANIDVLADLPSIVEICQAQVTTRDYLDPGLLAKAEAQYLQCLANVVAHNTPDAWSYLRGEPDTDAKQRCRLAWTEVCMFGKVCLPQLAGGKSKRNRNYNLIMKRLERWAAGERLSLWEDMPRRVDKEELAQDRMADARAKAKRHEAAIAFTQLGQPAKAVNRLVSLGMAPDTPAVEATMRS